MENTDSSPLDSPLILSILFYPHPARPGESLLPGAVDGTIPVGEGVHVGYRLYPHQPGAPTTLYFHGNGEIAPDCDELAPLYHRAGASLLVVDYRGYGWSSGQPRITTLLSDAEKVLDAAPGILEAAGLADSPLFVMGRSPGSAPAIHLAHRLPGAFRGLIVESGFASAVGLLRRFGLPVAGAADPFDNAGKIKSVRLPLLVIHGQRDELIPFSEGQALYDASPATLKRLTPIVRAGHNDLLFRGAEEYFKAVGEFVQSGK